MKINVYNPQDELLKAMRRTELYHAGEQLRMQGVGLPELDRLAYLNRLSPDEASYVDAGWRDIDGATAQILSRARFAEYRDAFGRPVFRRLR